MQVVPSGSSGGVVSSSSVRGVDHIGITVPDIELATQFFRDGLGAVHLYDLVADYEIVSPPGSGPAAPLGFDLEATVGVSSGTKLRALRLLRVGNGPSIELFEYEGVPQQDPARPSDRGLQHLAFYVDDIHSVAQDIAAAGGELLDGPHSMPGLETGHGALFHFARAPWGTYLELITYPEPQQYHLVTSRRRWTPQP
jgi:catechol 2,3-dioxygenase-like lactoylglutathione lyase family enzyme